MIKLTFKRSLSVKGTIFDIEAFISEYEDKYMITFGCFSENRIRIHQLENPDERSRLEEIAKEVTNRLPEPYYSYS